MLCVSISIHCYCLVVLHWVDLSQIDSFFDDCSKNEHSKTFEGDGYIHYLDGGDCFMDVYLAIIAKYSFNYCMLITVQKSC